MNVKDLIDVLTLVHERQQSAQVMIQVEDGGARGLFRLMHAAQRAYFDISGSRPVVVIDLAGHQNTVSPDRTLLLDDEWKISDRPKEVHNRPQQTNSREVISSPEADNA
jgi:hypothetical protein